MFHYQPRTSKTGRVIPKDAANLGLHHSFQAQASSVNERPPGKTSGDKKTHHENDFYMMPSVSNPVITPSTRFQFLPVNEGQIGNKAAANIQVAHSASDNLEFTRQLQNYQMFHELNKVQRQILHPVTAAVNDTVSLATNMKSSRECPVEQPVRTSNCSSRGQVIRQFNDVHLPGDRVIFTESSASPGIPIAYRLPEDRHANPDRLNLDR